MNISDGIQLKKDIKKSDVKLNAVKTIPAKIKITGTQTKYCQTGMRLQYFITPLNSFSLFKRFWYSKNPNSKGIKTNIAANVKAITDGNPCLITKGTIVK